MTALPSLSSTFEISPTSTPAMFTVWPWPGVTACAVDMSALRTKKSLPTSGTHAGSVSRCLPRMNTATAPAISDQAEDRHEVDPVLADRGPHGVPSPGPPAPAGPLTFGILLL